MSIEEEEETEEDERWYKDITEFKKGNMSLYSKLKRILILCIGTDGLYGRYVYV